MSAKDWQFQDIGVKLADSALLAGEEIEQLIAERNEMRKQKNFARADEIRKTLAEKGITLEDRPDGTTRWKR